MIRGVIEGWYGRPWSYEERLDLIRFCGDEGVNAWVHAPKDDPYHRARWREPYPGAELAQLARLRDEAAKVGVDFVVAIAPGLDVCYSRDDELEALLAKCAQLQSIGVTSFHLLWDDVEHTLNCADDERRYGDAEQPSGAAQCDFSNRFREALPQPGPLVVCPMGYAGTGDSPYRRSFAPDLHPEIVVYWTGPEVVSIGITREALNLAVARFRGHQLVIWDNYPVNDWDPDVLFLGPLTGRDPRLLDGGCAGLVANPMVQAIPSKLPLATVCEWMRDPHAYDPLVAFERALARYGPEVVDALGEARVDVQAPRSLEELVAALELGVDAPTARALLEPFV